MKKKSGRIFAIKFEICLHHQLKFKLNFEYGFERFSNSSNQKVLLIELYFEKF